MLLEERVVLVAAWRGLFLDFGDDGVLDVFGDLVGVVEAVADVFGRLFQVLDVGLGECFPVGQRVAD